MVPAAEQPWSPTGFSLSNQITGVEAFGSELFVVSPTEFARLSVDSADLQLIELRQFGSRLRTLGRPALHPLVFAKADLDPVTGEESIEFQLVREAVVRRRFAVDSLLGEDLALETDGSTIGAFSRDARLYLQPVVRRRTGRVAVLLFALDYTVDFSELRSLDFAGIVDVPDLLEDDAVVQATRYLDGAFYLATKTGGYRISETGVVDEVITRSRWVKDFFEYDGDYYASLAGLAEVFVSVDGEDFRPSGFVQELGLVDVFGDMLVTQEFEGWQYGLTRTLAQTPRPLALNGDFPRRNDAYFGIDRVGRTYFLGVDREVYVGAGLEAVEE